jgi:hypothetical protein
VSALVHAVKRIDAQRYEELDIALLGTIQPPR